MRLRAFPFLPFSPIIWAFCCAGGYSEKTEHLKVIENKVLNPSLMHDIQSVGHTWLLSHKTLQVQTVARALLHRWGTRRHFRCLSVLPNIGWAFDRGRERFALCVRPRTHDSILSGNPRVYVRSLLFFFLNFILARCCSLNLSPFSLKLHSLNIPHFCGRIPPPRSD